LLLVEDDAATRNAVARNLEAHGFRVEVAGDAAEAMRRLDAGRPDLVLLDLGLPDLDGSVVVRHIRRDGTTPILILSARADERDKVATLESGADDYVTKPFGLAVLLARVRALLRRGGPPNDERLHEFGDISVDVATRSVTRGGNLVALTFKEFDLHVALLERHGTVVTRRQLLEEVWEHQAEVQTRTVDMHVAELRRKLEPDPAHPKYILTVWKVGYRLER
jgi:DNA-binding response OmpR family regulator